MSKAQWHKIQLGVLPPDDVEIDHAMAGRLETAIVKAVGDVLGDWTMIMGFDCKLIPSAERVYPMCPAPGPFANDHR